MEKGMIIGLAGKAGSGKTYVADALVSYFKKLEINYEIVSFSTVLKQIVGGVFHKEFKIPSIDKTDTIAGTKMTYRELYQQLGTEFFRDKLNQDVWVNALFDRLDLKKNYIIDDVRFNNEAQRINKHNGKIFKLESELKGTINKTNTHSSEKLEIDDNLIQLQLLNKHERSMLEYNLSIIASITHKQHGINK